MVEFISSTIEPPSTASYPELRVSQKTVQRLRELSLQLDQLRLEGILTRSRILKHAADSALNFVFHSNKIEGSPLTIGETEVLATQTSYLSTDEKEALGAKTAYDWMVENCESVLQSPQPFWRTLNKILLNEVLNAAGSYRNDSVKISGAAFSPPEAFAVPEFLDRLTEEIRTSLSMRSPLELAAAVHAKFVWIHPFNDGNGRTARLLLNAILLASGLPIVVVNFDDRSRYMDALANADRGNLSPFVDLLLECLEYSLGSLKLPDRSDSNPEEEASEESSKTIPSNDPVEEALEELENTVIHNRDGAEPAAEISPEDDHDLLELVMASKLQAEQANYEAWKQAFESIAKQAEALAANFNRRYSPKGYSIDFRSYDMLTREKYDLLTNGFTAPRTWLFSWDLRSPNRHTRLMFFFQCSSQGARRIPDVAGASLAISRHDGDVYRRLSSEPIWLREIAYARGNLTSLGATERRDIPIVEALKNTLAETIKAYL